MNVYIKLAITTSAVGGVGGVALSEGIRFLSLKFSPSCEAKLIATLERELDLIKNHKHSQSKFTEKEKSEELKKLRARENWLEKTIKSEEDKLSLQNREIDSVKRNLSTSESNLFFIKRSLSWREKKASDLIGSINSKKRELEQVKIKIATLGEISKEEINDQSSKGLSNSNLRKSDFKVVWTDGKTYSAYRDEE